MTDHVSAISSFVVSAVVILPALIGAALIAAAIWRWFKMRSLAATGQRATAQIVDNQMQSRSEGSTTFRPVVTFRTSTGQEVKTVLADLGGFQSHIVGTELDVFYDPANPSDAVPVGKGSGRVVVTLVFGVIFLGFALLAYTGAEMVRSEFADFGGFPGDSGPDFDIDEFGEPPS